MGKNTKTKTEAKAEENGSPEIDGAIIALTEEGMRIKHCGSVKPMELPTLLRRAADFAEKSLLES